MKNIIFMPLTLQLPILCKNCPLYKVCRTRLTSCEIYCEKYSYIQSDEMWRVIP